MVSFCRVMEVESRREFGALAYCGCSFRHGCSWLAVGGCVMCVSEVYSASSALTGLLDTGTEIVFQPRTVVFHDVCCFPSCQTSIWIVGRCTRLALWVE